MKSKQPPKLECAACGSIVTERNRYYTGKYMTARDFQGEQEYFLGRHQAHNRLLHGWGIVCGLEVLPHPDSDCRSKHVVVKAGVALDCCGREIVLPADLVFEVPRPTAAAPAPAQAAAQTQTYEAASPARSEVLLCVTYTEDLIEYTPAIYSDGACEPEAEQPNRVREAATLSLLHLNQVEPGCWHRGAQHAKVRDDCDDAAPGQTTPCFEPECPCHHAVPLALLSYDAEQDASKPDPIQIDTSGRRHLPMHADFLTHIVSTNWVHAGRVTLAHLRHHMNGRLEIRFDRKIRPSAEHGASGVNGHTFLTQFGGVAEDIRPLPFPYKEPPRLEEDCVAVFRIDPKYLDPREIDDLRDKVVYVTLKCDFVVDCRGVPVDGAHLKGTLPTRSGRAGGVFESWFYVTGEEDERPRREPPEEPDSKQKTRQRRTT